MDFIWVSLTYPSSLLDLTDLLKDEIKGPASFKCANEDCAFSGNNGYYCSYERMIAQHLLYIEPAMDDLILGVFGDESIFLNCNSGECLHYTMVPGFSVCTATTLHHCT